MSKWPLSGNQEEIRARRGNRRCSRQRCGGVIAGQVDDKVLSVSARSACFTRVTWCRNADHVPGVRRSVQVQHLRWLDLDLAEFGHSVTGRWDADDVADVRHDHLRRVP
jgi:hypothetical protein